ETLDVTSRMKHPHYLDAIRDGAVEDEMLFKPAHWPHAQVREDGIAGFPGTAHAWHTSQELKSSCGCLVKLARCHNTVSGDALAVRKPPSVTWRSTNSCNVSGSSIFSVGIVIHPLEPQSILAHPYYSRNRRRLQYKVSVRPQPLFNARALFQAPSLALIEGQD